MPRIFVFYHFLHPDPVVSSVHFSELCESLAGHGWTVTGFAANRGSGKEDITYPPASSWGRVSIRRSWRPAWRQSSSSGRILNSLWMIACWSLLAVRFNPPDVIFIGTDPIFGLLGASLWRLLHPRTRIVHWCFDLYPEAAIADGVLPANGVAAGVLRRLMQHAYAGCDLIVDIGSCMRALLLRYGSPARHRTLVPWALSEPPAALPTPAAARASIFGTARLALMYSGTLGRAHEYEELVLLMRQLRGSSVHLAFSIKGNREDQLRASVQPSDTNISFIPFAPPSRLEERLATADIHIVSLRPEWTGTVVPSKFFGALAAGRPILFYGSPDSAIARWIEEFQVGWVLHAGRSAQIASTIVDRMEDPEAVFAMREHCFRVYQEQFSRAVVTAAWHEELTALLPACHSSCFSA